MAACLTGQPTGRQAGQHFKRRAAAGTATIKSFTILIKGKQRTRGDDSVAASVVAAKTILVSQFSLFYLPINEAIFLQVYVPNMDKSVSINL